MKTIPPVFESIGNIDSRAPSECSPDVSDWDYRGIKVNAPQKVIIADYFMLPVCVAHKYSMKLLNSFDNDFHANRVVVVVDLLTHKSYSGNLVNRGKQSVPRVEKMTGTDEELEDTTSTSFFNVDLYDFVTDLPEKPGKYLIYVMLNDIKSNTVEVEIEVAPGVNPGPRPSAPNF